MKTAIGIMICASLFSMACVQTVSSDNYHKNILYIDTIGVPTTDYQKERCKLDIQIPSKVVDKTTVIFFHGGGLTGGEKYVPYEIVSNGIIGVGVNYRLSPRGSCPDYLDDAAAAVAWVYKNIHKYGGDPSKIYVTGSSAGAYLTAMLALDTSYLAKHGISPDDIAGYFPLSAQTTTHFTIQAEREVSVGSDTELIDQYAPLYYHRRVRVPMLFVIGDRALDMPGRYDQNATMVHQLRRNGTEVHLWEMHGKDHGTFGSPALTTICRLIKNDSLRYVQDSIYFKPIELPEKQTTNLFYREDEKNGYSFSERMTCRLDLSIPKENSTKSTLIVLQTDDFKQSKRTVPPSVANKEMIGIGVQMRTIPSSKSTDCIDDAAAAVAWVYRHIEEYGGDRKRVYVAGTSAGGYLTALLALDTAYLAKHGIQADSIAGYFPISTPMAIHPTILYEQEMNGTPYSEIEKYSPLQHLRPLQSPLQLIVCDRWIGDSTIFVQNDQLKNLFQATYDSPNLGLWQMCSKDETQTNVLAWIEIAKAISQEPFVPYNFNFFEVANNRLVWADHTLQDKRVYSIAGNPINSRYHKEQVVINVETDQYNRVVAHKSIRKSR